MTGGGTHGPSVRPSVAAAAAAGPFFSLCLSPLCVACLPLRGRSLSLANGKGTLGKEREKEDGKRGKGYSRLSRTAEEGGKGGRTPPFPLYVKKAAAKAEEEEERCSLHFRYYVSCLDKCEGIAFP